MCKHCWDEGGPHHKDFIRGGVDPEDFEKEVNYHPKQKKSKKAKKYPGCPGNDKGPHIYVWTTEHNKSTLFLDYFGFHRYEQKVCCGCGHMDRRRKTPEYEERNAKEKDKAVRRGERVWKYWSFEDFDEGYREKRSRYIRQRGWDDYVYGWPW